MTAIAIAISGGVDSLVAAFLLKQQGHAVTGIHFRTGYEGTTGRQAPTAPPPSAIAAIGRQLDIPIEMLDMAEVFRETVVAYFVATYQAGRTPNPCLFCNPTIKFGRILAHARREGAEALATGHYARLNHGTDGRRRLYRGSDAGKDQSYFLARLDQEQLRHARFPLGTLTKDEVRAIARRNGLKPATRGESQDICFIRNASYADFLERQEGFQAEEGPIVDTAGQVLGRHQGLHLFTIGQRRGINCPASQPYYVVGLDRRRNRLIVGPRQDLGRQQARVADINWIRRPERSPVDVAVQIRYRHRPASARISLSSATGAEVHFDRPQEAVTPGQGAVFYDGDEVLGGGWIE
jgi:tRNA-specific 2-thiouridylase